MPFVARDAGGLAIVDGERLTQRRPEPALRFPTLILLAGVWLIVHPYEGLIHDGVLYAAQALRHAHPGIFANDPFFYGGRSQDDFTVFGYAYGMLVAAIGLQPASIAVFALCQAAWFAVALAWIRTAAPGLALAGVACLLALRHPYSALRALEVAESFVTARSLAEPLALAALLLALRRRGVAAAASLALAFAVHPLMAAPVLAALALFFLAQRFGWRWTCVAALAGFAAVAAGAHGLLPRMDDAWLGLVRRRSHVMVPGGWGLEIWARWAGTLTMLAIAARLAPRPFSALWAAIGMAGTLGVALAVAAYHARWGALIQVQPWRAMWLATWIAPLAIVSAAIALPREQAGLRYRLFALIPAFVFAQQVWVPAAALVSLGYCVLVALTLEARAGWFARERTEGAVFCGLVLGACALAGGVVGIVNLAGTPDAPDPVDRGARAFGAHLLGWAMAAAIGWWVAAGSGAGRFRVLRLRAAAGVVALLAVVLADGRPAMARELSRLQHDTLAGWQAIVPRDAQVLWWNRHGHVWLGLGRSSYVSRWQGAGSIFDRATAFEIDRRLRAIEPGFAKVRAPVGAPAPQRSPVDPAVADGPRRLCSADPLIGFVVLAGDATGSVGEPYLERFSARTYRLYACDAHR